MKLTCDTCQHPFEVSEGAAALGEVDCPKCGKPVTIGGPREGAVDLAAGGANDFFEVESTGIGGFVAEPPPKATDDKLLAEFGDFDALFNEAGGGKTAPPPASPPSSDGIDDLLGDFNLDTGGDAPKPIPSKPVAPPKPKSPPQAELDELFEDFVSDDQATAGASPPAEKAGIAREEHTSPGRQMGKPDAELEELFSEVSRSGVEASPEDEGGDALGSDLGIEYKQRKKKIPKQLLYALPALVVLVGITAVVMARFTTSGFFGWTFGQKAADGYEPPSVRVLQELNERYQKAAAQLRNDNADGYKKALVEFKEILKADPRNSPTDIRWVETLCLLGGNVIDPNNRKEVESLMAQAEKYHPGNIETLRGKGRATLSGGDLMKAESLARSALTINGKDVDTKLLLAEIAMARADWEMAAQEFTQILGLDPTSPRGKHLLAQVKVQQGRVEEAEALLRELVASTPPHPASEIDLWRLLASRYGKVAEAKQGLEAALANKASALSNSEQGRAWRYLAEIAESSNDTVGAIAALEKALAADPLNHANAFHLGRLCLDRKDFEKAADQFGRASRLAPTDAEYLIYRGYALREQKKPDEAFSELQKGLERSPGNVIGLYQLGLTQRDLQRPEDAIASLETALKNDPNHLDSMIVLGELYLQKDNFAMARTQLTAAIARAPKSSRAHNALGEVHLTLVKGEEALAEFKMAEAEDPSNVVILSNMGKAYLLLKNTGQAAAYFQKALSIDSTRVDTQVALGELQHQRKEYTQSLETFRRVLEMQPKDFATRVKLARVLIDQQTYQEAVNELLEAAKYSPSYYPTRLSLGVAWRGLGNLDASLEELGKATQIRPEAGEAHYQLELTHIFRNDPITAEQEMDKALADEPKRIDPLTSLGDYFDQRSLYAKAVEYFLRAEKIEPRNAVVLLRIAETYRRDQAFKKAKAYFQRVVEVDRKNVDGYVGLGLLAEEDQKTTQALTYYRKAQSVDPDDPRPYYYLGFLYKYVGQRMSAVLAFKKYLKLDPESKEKEDILEEIRMLGGK